MTITIPRRRRKRATPPPMTYAEQHAPAWVAEVLDLAGRLRDE